MRIRHLVSDRLALLISLTEVGIGFLLYGYPHTFRSAPALVQAAPWLSALFLIGGMGTLIMIRHPLPHWAQPLRALPTVGPWLVSAALVPTSPLGAASLVWGGLGLTTLLLQPGRGRRKPTEDRLDLVDLLFGLLELAAGAAILVAPPGTGGQWLALLQRCALPAVLVCPVGSAAVFGKLWRPRRSPREESLRRVLTTLPPVLLAVTAALSGSMGALYFCGVAVLVAPLTADLPPHTLRVEPGSLIPLVVTRVEIGSWALATAAIALSLIEDASGDRLMRPMGAVVNAITVYNIVIYWLFPRLGSAGERLHSHLVIYTAACSILLAFTGRGPIAQGAILLLIIPPMLAAQAFGLRAATFHLGLGAVAILLADSMQTPTLTALAGHSDLFIREIVYIVAGVMVSRSAAQQSRLVRELHQAERELRAANEDLAARRQELAAQQEELAAQNDALAESAVALAKLANFDALTGLANRRSFQNLLEAELQRSRSEACQGAIVFLDLDRFKYINDSLGHSAGDRLLQRAGSALERAVGETGTVARLGGDEFAVLLPGADAERACTVVEGILGSLHEERLVVNNEEIPIRASAGIALYPGDSDTSEGLLQAADIAMYAAKEAGRDGYSLFLQSGAQFVKGDPRVYWQREVQAALAEDRLLLHFQPVVESATGRTVSYEVLLRMRSRSGEIIYPDAFLPTLEGLPALMHAVDRWVVRHSIQLLATSRREGRRLALQVNLSALSVTDPEMLPLIETLLAETGVDPASLTFEVTESSIAPDVQECLRFAQAVRRLGCGVATDDFGGGFASLTRLLNLPVRQLKIAGSLVQNLSARPQDLPIIRAIVEMARSMGIQTVAEWVEDAETYALLRDLGVDYVQGFLFGRPAERPVPAEDGDR